MQLLSLFCSHKWSWCRTMAPLILQPVTAGLERYRLQWAVALWLHPLYRCPQFYQRQPSATGSQLRQSPPLMPMLLMVLQ